MGGIKVETAPSAARLEELGPNLVSMRVGLEQPRFHLRRRGCVWTNFPYYGKIL
jgi:hypothetical protein